MTQKSEAQKGNITPEMEYVAEYENIDVNKLAKLIDKGLVVIPKNINGHSKPCGIGECLKTKINANIGSSSKIDDIDLEIDKAKLAQEYGADALMDLSTGSDLKLFRRKIMEAVDICIGTVPIYEEDDRQRCTVIAFSGTAHHSDISEVVYIDIYTEDPTSFSVLTRDVHF